MLPACAADDTDAAMPRVTYTIDPVRGEKEQMTITAIQVKDLREKTGAAMMDCKRALEQTSGNEEKAITILREKGLLVAAKREGKQASEGRVEAYIHAGGKIGVLLELNCETDFVAKTDDFQQLARELAMQIAAANPTYVDRTEVPEAVIEQEKEIYRTKAQNEGKPAQAIDKIVAGQVEKFFETVCLLDQPNIREPKQKVIDLINERVGKVGEKIVVRRFARYKVGTEA
jgi:elongation factor Ts